MLNFNVMQASILSSLRIKNLFQALDCVPEIEDQKGCHFLMEHLPIQRLLKSIMIVYLLL